MMTSPTHLTSPPHCMRASGNLNYVQQKPGFEVEVTIPEYLVPVASQYPSLKIDTTRGLLSGDARVVAITVGFWGGYLGLGFRSGIFSGIHGVPL